MTEVVVNKRESVELDKVKKKNLDTKKIKERMERQLNKRGIIDKKLNSQMHNNKLIVFTFNYSVGPYLLCVSLCTQMFSPVRP